MTEQEVHETSNDFELMDREDEEQILAELRGVPVDKFIYQNKRGEWDLTYAGAKWVVRKMAEEGEAIRIDGHPKVERCPIDPEYITVTVLGKRVKIDREAKCETLLDTNVGAARGWIKMPTNNGPVADPFWFNKTVSKACRNLQLSLIPTDFKRRMIEHLQKTGGANGANRGQASQRSAAGQGAANQQRTQTQGGSKSMDQPPSQGAQQTGQKPGQAAGAAQNASQGQSKPSNAAAGQQKASGTKPQGQQQRPANPGEASLEAVQQGFRAVFLQFAGTEDKPTLQKILKVLTGKTAITDLEKALMVELGPLLRRKIKGEVKWTGTALHEISSGEQLWPKVEPQADPPVDSAAPQGEPPPSDEVPMF